MRNFANGILTANHADRPRPRKNPRKKRAKTGDGDARAAASKPDASQAQKYSLLQFD